MTNQIVQNIPIHVQRLAQVHSFDFYCMVSWLTTFGTIVGRHYLNLEPTEYDSRLNRVENHQLNHTKRSLSPAFIATIEFLSLWIMNYSLRKLSSTIPSTRPCGFVSAEIFEQYLYHLPLNAWQNMNALNDNIPCAVGTNLQKNFWSNHSGNTAITAVEIILFMTLAARVLKNQSSNQVNAVQKFLHSHMSNNYIDLASTFIQIIGVSLAMGTAASRVIANCHSLSAVLNGMVQGSIQAMFAMQAIEVARPVINRLYNATLSFFSTSPNRSETQEDNTVDEMPKQS